MKRFDVFPALSPVKSAILGLLIYLSALTPVLAQVPAIAFTNPQEVYLVDTQLYYLDSLRFNYGLRNNSGVNMSAQTVSLNIAVYDSSNVLTFSGLLDSFSLTLNAGDTTGRRLATLLVNPNNFQLGGGVVVIWPSIVSQTVADTVHYRINVLNALSLHAGIAGVDGFGLFPNPCHERIGLSGPGLEDISAWTFRILSADGRTLQAFPPDGAISWNTASLSSGLYWLEAKHVSGRRKTMPFLKE